MVNKQGLLSFQILYLLMVILILKMMLRSVDIVKPTNKDNWTRMNPICGSPMVKIRNRGFKIFNISYHRVWN